MEEVFGYDGEPLGLGERFCNEPLVKHALYTKVIHVRARELHDGDFECTHCGARFLGPNGAEGES